MADEQRSCPLCGRTSIGALVIQPVSDDPAVLDRLLRGLRKLARDVEKRRVAPAWVHHEGRWLCASCRGLLSGIIGIPRRQELIQHLRLQIRRIEARLEAEEEDREPSAEHALRLPGPGDHAAQ